MLKGGPTDEIAYVTGRGVAAGLDENRHPRGKRDVERKDVLVADLDALRGSVHFQLDLRQAGIDAYIEIAAGAGIVAPLGDVDSRLTRPIRLIPVKSILARRAIVRHKSLVVPARRVALIATVAGEIKHVPNELTPQVSASFHRLPIRLMEWRPPLVRMERATWSWLRRRRLMLSHACPSTVLADAQWPALERLVQLVDVIRNIGQTASVPPEIYVVSDYIGPTSECHAIDSAASCEGGEPTEILGPGQGVQCLDRLGRVRASATSQLIRYAPEDNRRMIIVLTNEL